MTQKRRFYSPQTVPNSLDIVWCSFPYAEMPDRPGPKQRPALVRAVYLSKSGEKAFIEVTYGTSKKTPHTNPRDLHIVNVNEMNACGLPQATCFVLDRTIKLPWAEDFFIPREAGSSPIIGHLPNSSISQLETLKVIRRFP